MRARVSHDRQKFPVQVHISRVSNLQGRKQFLPLPPVRSRAQAHPISRSITAPRCKMGCNRTFFSSFPLFYLIVFPLQLHAADRFRVSNDKGTRARIGTIDVCTFRDGDICRFPLKLDRDRNIQIFSPFDRL